MKKLKKVTSVALISAFIASSSISVVANNNELISGSSKDSGNKIEIKLSKNEVKLKGDIGTVIHDGDLIFTRVSNDSMPSTEITPYASKQDYTVTFKGETDTIKEFNLAGSYAYWKVWIKNTGGSAIKYSTTGPKNSTVYSIPAGSTWNVHSTSKWPVGTYRSNFTSGSGLYGEAACRIATTFAELDI